MAIASTVRRITPERQRKFGKIFAPEIKLAGFKFAACKLAAAGQLVPQEIIAKDGWLAVGYRRATPSGGVAVAKD